MNNMDVSIIVNVAVGLVTFVLGYMLRQYKTQATAQTMRRDAENMLAKAKTRLHEAELEAKSAALKIRDDIEQEMKKERSELGRQERRLQQRRASLDRRIDSLEKRGRKLDSAEKRLELKHNELEGLRRKELEELERISQLTMEEAKEIILQRVESEARQDMARVVREVEAQAKEEGGRKAQEIITLAIQRIASDQVAETTVSTVPLPNDEMKGRIIGRGGRNIRAIESATGVNLLIDDTPEAVILSSFDPVRREIARVALSKLILDGRIHPARIEKVVSKAQREVEAIIQEEGERAAYEVGIHGLRPELVTLLGRLKYRTSYGQNVLMHSVETAHLASMMAEELGANVRLAREAGLLHDLGKAVSHEIEGPHARIGADIAQQFGRPADVVNAIAAHHGEDEYQTLEAILVEAADAVSGARPGARREALESYLKRVESLENLAASFAGVEKSYAIQAGREIRIIVKPDQIDDLGIITLSRDIAKKVEESLQYPGQIKVTVVREMRAVDYAK
jgi:ribonuclease Y